MCAFLFRRCREILLSICTIRQMRECISCKNDKNKNEMLAVNVHSQTQLDAFHHNECVILYICAEIHVTKETKLSWNIYIFYSCFPLTANLISIHDVHICLAAICSLQVRTSLVTESLTKSVLYFCSQHFNTFRDNPIKRAMTYDMNSCLCSNFLGFNPKPKTFKKSQKQSREIDFLKLYTHV
jgi:hypothetical protein